MRKSRFSEEQIIAVLKESDRSSQLGVCREYVSTSLTLRWRYIEQHQNRKREPALPHWLPPYARKALFRSSCNGFALLIP